MTHDESELVERVRVIFAAVNRQDWDTVMSFFRPDSVLDTTAAGLQVFEGTAAIRAFWEEFVRMFDGSTYALDEVADLGRQVVLAVFTVTGPAPGSSVAMTQRFVYVYEWDGDLVRRITGFADMEAARAFADQRAADA